MKKVSFDFDDTLTLKNVQDYAKDLIKKGIEVHVVTSRYEDPKQYTFECNHDDLFTIIKEIGIDKKNVHFTNFTFKHKFFKNNTDFIWHLDDNYQEKYAMGSSGCKTICVLHKDGEYFENKCDELLNIN